MCQLHLASRDRRRSPRPRRGSGPDGIVLAELEGIFFVIIQVSLCIDHAGSTLARPEREASGCFAGIVDLTSIPL